MYLRLVQRVGKADYMFRPVPITQGKDEARVGAEVRAEESVLEMQVARQFRHEPEPAQATARFVPGVSAQNLTEDTREQRRLTYRRISVTFRVKEGTEFIHRSTSSNWSKTL